MYIIHGIYMSVTEPKRTATLLFVQQLVQNSANENVDERNPRWPVDLMHQKYQLCLTGSQIRNLECDQSATFINLATNIYVPCDILPAHHLNSYPG